VSTPHIFVVEDDPDVRTSIAEILRDEGYEVGEYSNLDDTLCELRAGARPCVVLMDLLMPGMTGPEFLEAVRADVALREIAVVMITGTRTAATGIEILRKPFDLSDLVDTVARHCRHATRDARASTDPDSYKAGRPAP
jgi:DNA-binding NtrC family response regulator